VIAVVEEMKDRLVSVGVPIDRISVVENFVDVDRFLSYPIDHKLRDELRNRYVISYIGGFGAHRGLDTAIRAMERVAQAIPDALLLLVGKGPTSDDLEQLSARLSLAEHVRFAGQVDFARVPSYVDASDVCIIPHIKSVQTEAALPHKLFQYMLLGKPVVASSCAGVARVVMDADCGLLFPPGDSGALADALISLTDERLRDELGERGRAAVLDRYSRSVSGRKLCGLYEGLQTSAGERASTSSG
jgi:glycosyltransferase involved in cell wall biosynthesis